MIESHCNATCSIVQIQRHLNSSRTGLIRCMMFWLLWRLPWCSGRSKEAPGITVTVPLKKTTQASLRSAGATVVANADQGRRRSPHGGQAGWCSSAVGVSVLQGMIYPRGTGITCLGPRYWVGGAHEHYLNLISYEIKINVIIKMNN